VRSSNGTYSRTPFGGNRIPQNRFDPAVLKFLGFGPWSAQTDPLSRAFIDRTGVVNNFNFDSRKRSFRTGFDYKIDHSFSDRHNMFGRYSNLRNRADTGDRQAVFANQLFDYNFTPIPPTRTRLYCRIRSPSIRRRSTKSASASTGGSTRGHPRALV